MIYHPKILVRHCAIVILQNVYQAYTAPFKTINIIFFCLTKKMESLSDNILFLIHNFYDANIWSIPLSKNTAFLPLNTPLKISLIRNYLSNTIKQPIDSPTVDCLMSVIIFHVPTLFEKVLILCKKINDLTTTHEWSFREIRNAWLRHSLSVDRLFEISMEEFDRVMADMRKRLRLAQGAHDDDYVILDTREDDERNKIFRQETRKKCIEVIPLYDRLFSIYQITTFAQFNRFARHETR